MRLILVFFIGLISLSSNTAQESLTLDKCILLAIENSLTMQEMQLALRNSNFDLEAAQAARHPNLNGNANLGLNFGRTIDPTKNEFVTTTFFANNYGLNSGMLLYNGGRINNTIKQNEIFSKAFEADKTQAERDIALQVALFYLNVVFAEENLKLSQNQSKITLDQIDQLEKFIKAGTRPANDILELEAQYAMNDQNIVLAQNSYDINLLQLKQLLRIDLEKDIKLSRPDNIESSIDPDLLSFDEVYQAALKSFPSVKAGKYRYDAAQLSVDLAESSLYPTVSAQANIATNYSNQGKTVDGFNFIREEQEVFVNNQSVTLGIDQPDPILSNTPYVNQLSDNISYGVGVGMNIPIYNNKSAKINVEKAKLNAMSSKIGIERILENLKVTIQQALIDARASKKKLKSTRLSLKAQRAAFENTTKRLELGAASTFEWANQQAQVESLEINELIDKYNYLFNLKVIEFYLGKPMKF